MYSGEIQAGSRSGKGHAVTGVKMVGETERDP